MSIVPGAGIKVVANDGALAARVAAIETELARLAHDVETLKKAGTTAPAKVANATDQIVRLQLDTKQVAAELGAMPAFVMTPLALLCLESEQLTLVKGIDAAAATLLNEVGIHRFADIAALTAEDVEQLGGKLGDRRRICRQGWIEQAALLAAGTQTAHATRVRAGDYRIVARQAAAAAASAKVIDLASRRAKHAPGDIRGNGIWGNGISGRMACIAASVAVLVALTLNSSGLGQHLGQHQVTGSSAQGACVGVTTTASAHCVVARLR